VDADVLSLVAVPHGSVVVGSQKGLLALRVWLPGSL
jgi:hypothetical protein